MKYAHVAAYLHVWPFVCEPLAAETEPFVNLRPYLVTPPTPPPDPTSTNTHMDANVSFGDEKAVCTHL